MYDHTQIVAEGSNKNLRPLLFPCEVEKLQMDPETFPPFLSLHASALSQSIKT